MMGKTAAAAALLVAARVLSPVGAEEHWHDPSPHRVRFVTVEKNLQLEVLDWGGSGRPLVLLAGSGATAHQFDEFAPKLTGRYHVYGITRRGFGASGFVDGEFGAEVLGHDVVAVMNALKLDEPILAGHSFAGLELSTVANHYPGRVAGLVYLEAGYTPAFDNGKGLSMAEFQQIVRAPEPPPPEEADLANFRALRDYWERTRGFRLTESELRQEWEALPDGRVGQRRNFPGSAVLMKGVERYSNIPAPALFIFANPHELGSWYDNNRDPATRTLIAAYSTEFRALTQKQEDALRDAVPTARIVTLPNANHSVFVSNEQEVLSEIHAFIDGLP